MVGSLLKGIFFLIFSGFIAYLLMYLTGLPGFIILNIDGREISASILTAFLLFVLGGLMIWFVIYLIGFPMALARFFSGQETAISRYFDKASQVKGYNALATALVAFNEGDSVKALSQCSRAKRLLKNNKLSILINAQMAEQTGESKLAITNYKKLLEYKDTRLVALNGIVSEKIKLGDNVEALTLAKKTLELNPKNLNVLTTLFNLQLQERDWDGARKTLQFKKKYAKVTKDVFLRQEALLILADAKEKRANGYIKEALTAALTAVRLYPGFVAALSFLTELEVLSGNKKRVEKLLKKGWAAFPHPDIAKSYASLIPDEIAEARLKRFEKFLNVKSDDPQTLILHAELLLASENFLGARKVIYKLVTEDPDNRTLTLMAAIERGSGATDTIVRGWLAKAVYAVRSPRWVCDECGFQGNWDLICSACDNFDTVRWKRPQAYKDNNDNSQLLPLITGSNPTNGTEEQNQIKALNERISENNKTEKKSNQIQKTSDNSENDIVKKARETL